MGGPSAVRPYPPAPSFSPPPPPPPPTRRTLTTTSVAASRRITPAASASPTPSLGSSPSSAGSPSPLLSPPVSSPWAKFPSFLPHHWIHRLHHHHSLDLLRLDFLLPLLILPHRCPLLVMWCWCGQWISRTTCISSARHPCSGSPCESRCAASLVAMTALFGPSVVITRSIVSLLLVFNASLHLFNLQTLLLPLLLLLR